MSSRERDTLLIARARDFLGHGPSDPVAIVEHICQLPGAPRIVAEHMARALLAGHPEFVAGPDGLWRLALPRAEQQTEQAPAPSATVVELPVASRVNAPRGLAALSYAVVDVETTGSSPDYGDRITEIAAVVVKEGVVVERFETLVNPERSIPPMITALTRISWNMVKDAPRFRDVCDDVLRVLDGRVFVAHNADFDWRFVRAEVERASGRMLQGPRLCTVRLARKLLPQLRSRKLDSVCNHYGVEIPALARHRAGGDAEATARILLRLLDDARGRECHSWDELQRLLAQRSSSTRRRRPPAMPRPVDRDTTA